MQPLEAPHIPKALNKANEVMLVFEEMSLRHKKMEIATGCEAV